MQTFVDTSDISENEWCPLFGRLPEPDWAHTKLLLKLIQNMREIWGVMHDTWEVDFPEQELKNARSLYSNAGDWLQRLDEDKKQREALGSEGIKMPGFNNEAIPVRTSTVQENHAIAILCIFSAKKALEETSERWISKADELAKDASSHQVTIAQVKAKARNPDTQAERERALKNWLRSQRIPEEEWMCLPNQYSKRMIYETLKKLTIFEDKKAKSDTKEAISHNTFVSDFWKNQKICKFKNKNKK